MNPVAYDRELAAVIDHTLLRANALAPEVETLCQEAAAYGFAAVCVNGVHVARAAAALAGTSVRVCTVVGFPLGASLAEVKALEAGLAMNAGAHEVDMVVDLCALFSGEVERTRAEIELVRAVVRAGGGLLKVILETGLLDEAAKRAGCQAARDAGADFVKTSTGFAASGATVDDVRLMREVVGPAMGVKASGGIRSAEIARAMLAAGATRLGTSASLAIVGA